MNEEGLLKIVKMLEIAIRSDPMADVYLEVNGEKIMGCYTHDFMLRPKYELLELDMLNAYIKVKERLGDTPRAIMLKYYRLAADLEIDALSKLLDISTDAIENWESDIELPDDESYEQIMKILIEKFAGRVFDDREAV